METLDVDAPLLVTTLVLVSIVTLVASIIALPVIVVRLPHDYFLHERKPLAVGEMPTRRHPVIIVLKNVLGLVLVVGGIAMLVLPGQGILSIVAGLALVDFPRKRRLQRFILLKSGARHVLDRIRHRAGKGPFHFDHPDWEEEEDQEEDDLTERETQLLPPPSIHDSKPPRDRPPPAER